LSFEISTFKMNIGGHAFEKVDIMDDKNISRFIY
jgi:hypothetical protein